MLTVTCVSAVFSSEETLLRHYYVYIKGLRIYERNHYDTKCNFLFKIMAQETWKLQILRNGLFNKHLKAAPKEMNLHFIYVTNGVFDLHSVRNLKINTSRLELEFCPNNVFILLIFMAFMLSDSQSRPFESLLPVFEVFLCRNTFFYFKLCITQHHFNSDHTSFRYPWKENWPFLLLVSLCEICVSNHWTNK